MTQLKQIRRKRKLTMVMLAKMMNITPQCVFYHEKRGIRKKITAERYAAILKCSWQDLFD